MESIKLGVNIQAAADREKMLIALGNSGFPVWVEERDDGYFICFTMNKEEGNFTVFVDGDPIL